MYVTPYPELILGLRPANERRRYKVTPPLIGWRKPSISPAYLVGRDLAEQ